MYCRFVAVSVLLCFSLTVIPKYKKKKEKVAVVVVNFLKINFNVGKNRKKKRVIEKITIERGKRQYFPVDTIVYLQDFLFLHYFEKKIRLMIFRLKMSRKI